MFIKTYTVYKIEGPFESKSIACHHNRLDFRFSIYNKTNTFMYVPSKYEYYAYSSCPICTEIVYLEFDAARPVPVCYLCI